MMNKMIIGLAIMSIVVAGTAHIASKKRDVYDEEMHYDEEDYL